MDAISSKIPVGRRPRLVGREQEVPRIDGTTRRYVNLDFAASTPPLEEVANAVGAMMSWYSSVHRGSGWKSQVSTAAYEGARQAVAAFLSCRPDDAVIFTRNTTDSSNMLAHCLPDDTLVITSPVEHHANMLPWRQGRVEYIPIPTGPDDLLRLLELHLRKSHHGNTLVALGGASNVTGQITPILGVACTALMAASMDHLAEAEGELLDYAPSRLAAVPGLQMYSLWGRARDLLQ
jgi:selenocysteine lyase/cysteine desulfurase